MNTIHTHKDREKNYVIQALELHGCMFPGSCCQTQIMTNGNAPCSLINFCISATCYVKITHVKMFLKKML